MSSINVVAQQVNAVAKFNTDLHALMEVLNVADVRKVRDGGSVMVYAEKEPETVTYVEGQEIPNSDVTPVAGDPQIITWTPKRSLATYQKIQSETFDVAVGGTADKLRKMIGAGFRTSLCTAINTGTGTATQAATVQQAAANATAKLMEVTAEEAGTPIILLSPMTWAAYAGAANISTQTAFGLNYVKGFLGVELAIILPGLTDNVVYATTAENINFVCADIAAISAEMQTDESGVFGIVIKDEPAKHGYDVVVSGGMKAFLNVLARCIKCTVGA